ncbi:SDR family NAD(P)-dependent oxidoreductase [Candidatus Parcubacteria bacterium]|nr:SDR family NAD(P)-dependent oxidoreductase [Candidatus Parcubacteria bacterium]
MLEGKTIIVIGATGGIGRVLSKAFVQARANVVLSARTEGKLEELIKDLGSEHAIKTRADATRPEEVEEVFAKAKAKFGSVDAVVISAGTWDRLSLGEPVANALELGKKHFEALFLPSFVVGYIAQKKFLEAGRGLIINISSHAALRPELKGNLTYGPMKAASHHFMLALRHELADTGVRVTDLAPAIVNTPEGASFLSTEEKRRQAVQPEEIANWIIENFDNPDIPDTKLFKCSLLV